MPRRTFCFFAGRPPQKRGLAAGGLDFYHPYGYNKRTQQNNIGFVAFAAFSARTRDFFAASVKFEGFERAAPVPAAAGHVPRAFPRAPAGRRGTGRGAGRAHQQAEQQKKHRVFRLGAFLCIHGNESVCIAPGCTSLDYNSTPAGGCQHRSRIKSNLSSPRGFTNCVDVV